MLLVYNELYHFLFKRYKVQTCHVYMHVVLSTYWLWRFRLIRLPYTAVLKLLLSELQMHIAQPAKESERGKPLCDEVFLTRTFFSFNASINCIVIPNTKVVYYNHLFFRFSCFKSWLEKLIIARLTNWKIESQWQYNCSLEDLLERFMAAI